MTTAALHPNGLQCLWKMTSFISLSRRQGKRVVHKWRHTLIWCPVFYMCFLFATPLICYRSIWRCPLLLLTSKHASISKVGGTPVGNHCSISSSSCSHLPLKGVKSFMEPSNPQKAVLPHSSLLELELFLLSLSTNSSQKQISFLSFLVENFRLFYFWQKNLKTFNK